MSKTISCESHDDTFAVGEQLGRELEAGNAVLLHGELGAGKTVLTKGALNSLGFDPAEVTSPSFALVNLYPTSKFDVYHIDLWRVAEGSDAAFEVGLDDIEADENSVVIIEWAERLGDHRFGSRVFDVSIEMQDDDSRVIEIVRNDIEIL
jgi:tRNA threonylcarbamoyladenosine biosynthesis protein TsaE